MPPTLKACLWMMGTIGSFTAMAIAGRAVSLDLDIFEIMLYRSVLGFVLVVTVAGLAGRLSEVSTRSMRWHGLRNLFHFTGQNLWFYAITVIPLAQVFALEFTSPLWVILLSALILGERVTPTRALAAGIGFVGILVVTRPAPDSLQLGQVAAAAAAIGFAGSAVFTRYLTRTETITSILFWLTALQTVMGLVCAGIDGSIALPTLASLPWVAVIATAGIVAHFCLTTALSLAPATVVMPIDFVRLPVIALVGIAFYAEPLDPFVALGGALILLANYANIRAETRRPTSPKP